MSITHVLRFQIFMRAFLNVIAGRGGAAHCVKQNKVRLNHENIFCSLMRINRAETNCSLYKFCIFK